MEYVQKQVRKKISKAIEKLAKFDFIRSNSKQSTALSMSVLSSYIYRNPTLFAKILRPYFIHSYFIQWRTQEFCSRVGGRGSTNSFEDRQNGDLEAVAP